MICPPTFLKRNFWSKSPGHRCQGQGKVMDVHGKPESLCRCSANLCTLYQEHN